MSIDNQQTWLETALGQYLQAQEQALFDDAVVDVFGFNAVQLGLPQMDLLRNSRIPFLIQADALQGTIRCDSVQLPIAANSIDLLLLPHSLDFSPNPQQTLREVERVLVAEGHVILTGFNPVSPWGLKRLLNKQNKPDPQGVDDTSVDNNPNFQTLWDGNFLSLLRVRDWLELLGFEVLVSRMACYAPPFSKTSWLQRFEFADNAARKWWPMTGGVYFIVAKKKVVGMRLIRPNWSKAKFKPRLVATPTQKGDSQKSIKSSLLK